MIGEPLSLKLVYNITYTCIFILCKQIKYINSFSIELQETIVVKESLNTYSKLHIMMFLKF